MSVVVSPTDNTEKRLLDPPSENCDWSPDGRQIAFDDGKDVYVVSRDGSGMTRLTSSGDPERGPTFAPDGRLIAYVRAGDLWIMNADGSDPHGVAKNAAELDWQGLPAK